MESKVKKHVAAPNTWSRGLNILLFIFIYNMGEFLLGAIVIFQFIFLLVSGQRNEQLFKFSQTLRLFFYQVIGYITLAEDKKPFPFAPWPDTQSKKDLPKEGN